MKTIIVFFFCLFFFSCGHQKYVHDKAFISPTDTGSSEYHALINNALCKDMDGKVGACFKRVKSNEDLEIKIMAQQYEYRFVLTCSSELDFNTSIDVLKMKELRLTVPYTKYKNLKSFTCRGKIYPKDREEAIAMRFTFRVEIISATYTPREAMVIVAKDDKNILILGQHALHSRVYDCEEWHYYYKEPFIEVHDLKKLRAISESFLGRMNYYGF